jgi:hypothetical protein
VGQRRSGQQRPRGVHPVPHRGDPHGGEPRDKRTHLLDVRRFVIIVNERYQLDFGAPVKVLQDVIGAEVIEEKENENKSDLGLATYSNSESTVLSYASIFENLWAQSN